MKKINDFNVVPMRQQQAFEFYNKVWENVKPLFDGESAYLPLQPVCEEFKLALDDFDISLKPLRKSEITRKLTEEDKNRNRAWKGLRTHVKNMLNSFDAETVECAMLMNNFIHLYGDPSRLAYTEKTGTLRNLIDDLEYKVKTAVMNRVGVAEWFDRLKSSNQSFIELMKKREVELKYIESGQSLANRDRINQLYRKLVEQLNAHVLVGNKPDILADIVLEVNQIIDQERMVLKARKTRKNTAGIDPEKPDEDLLVKVDNNG